MPIYEYVCEADGTVLEALRSMADADKPLADPEGKGRRFVRKMSTFAAQGSPGAGRGSGGSPSGGCCPCGKSAGSCGMKN